MSRWKILLTLLPVGLLGVALSLGAQAIDPQSTQTDPVQAQSQPQGQPPAQAPMEKQTNPGQAQSQPQKSDEGQAQSQPKSPSESKQKGTEELPKTASPLPLVGLVGLSSFGGALALRVIRRRKA